MSHCEKDMMIYSKYEYLQPSIRDVLLMEGDDLTSEFLQTHNIDATKSVFVDTESLTIKWDILEKYTNWKDLSEDEDEDKETKTTLQQEFIPMDVLASLATDCELALFYERRLFQNLSLPIQGLMKMVENSTSHGDSRKIEDADGESHVFIATLLALNMVESSIRHLTGKEHGRAPLLKDMIEITGKHEVSGDRRLPRSLAPLLRSLLLPNGGINLRNLLWHGFLPVIGRRWFALSVVLTISMDDLAGTSSFGSQLDDNVALVHNMRNYTSLCHILDYGEQIRLSNDKTKLLQDQLVGSAVIPTSYNLLCKAAFQYLDQPVIFASVVGPLIEHALRILWCDANGRNKSIADSHTYYVTLDGHGQRDKHDIVLMPYLSKAENEILPSDDSDNMLSNDGDAPKNKLVYKLGGPTMALLIDLFASPAGAPNVRASVAHGLFNKYLFEELDSMHVVTNGRTNSSLNDMTNALLSVLHILSSKEEESVHFISYRPVFSYSALLLAEVDNVLDSLKSLHEVISERLDRMKLDTSSGISESSMQRDVGSSMASLSQSIESIGEVQARIYRSFRVEKSTQWSVENTFQESFNNLIASECGAATLLLSEISTVASSCIKDLNSALAEIEGQQLPNRRRKQIYRIFSVAQLTYDFYSFAAFCALLHIDRRAHTRIQLKSKDCPLAFAEVSDETIFLSVKRSRMAVSTFSNAKMLDRALKAVQQYALGKAVKAIGQTMKNSKGPTGRA